MRTYQSAQAPSYWKVSVMVRQQPVDSV